MKYWSNKVLNYLFDFIIVIKYDILNHQCKVSYIINIIFFEKTNVTNIVQIMKCDFNRVKLTLSGLIFTAVGIGLHRATVDIFCTRKYIYVTYVSQ